MRMARPSLAIAALALTGATTITACTTTASSPLPTGPGGAFGTIPATAAGPQHSGTITWAEYPGSGPTWILPIFTSIAYDVSDVNEFEDEMWRPLYWFDDGVQPVESPVMSLAYAPKWSTKVVWRDLRLWPPVLSSASIARTAAAVTTPP